jgi:hypothetical protein
VEKIEFRGMWVRGDFYNATDVDTLLADVRRLVEAAKTARTFLINRNLVTIAYRVDMQIAAVERHLATSPPHSSPPPADTGKA